MTQQSREEGDRLPPGEGGTPPRFGEIAGNALRYWEPRRVLYNLVLLAVVVAEFAAAWPASKEHLSPDPFFILFLMAVLANIAYCAVYAIDLFVQYSAVRAPWTRARWLVLLVGTAFAAVLAHFVMRGILSGPPGD